MTEESLQQRINELEKQQSEIKETEQENLQTLQAAFMNLSPGGAVPAEIPSIIKAIEVLSEGLSIHVKNAEEKMAEAVAENKALEERMNQLETEVQDAKQSAEQRESELAQVRGELAQEKEKLAAVQSELHDERSKLNALQSQHADGDTGTDALRQRVVEDERKLGILSQRLAEVEAQARESEKEVCAWKNKLKAISESEREATTRIEIRGSRAKELSQQLFEQVEKMEHMLEQLGFTVIRQDGEIVVQRASKVNASSGIGDSLAQSGVVSVKPDPSLLDWMQAETAQEETDQYMAFLESLYQFDVDVFGDAVVKRVKDIELLARKWQKEARGYRDKYHRMQSEAHDKIAYRSFKEGDLALFLPTRNQAIRSWAAFNVGAPHYFLREQDAHKLQTRDWLLARITKIEERVVDLSKSMNGAHPDRRSIGGPVTRLRSMTRIPSNCQTVSDGTSWMLMKRSPAPLPPRAWVKAPLRRHVDARGSIRLKRTSNGGNVAKTLTKSLDSRRNSSSSKKGPPFAISQRANESTAELARPAEANTPVSRAHKRQRPPLKRFAVTSSRDREAPFTCSAFLLFFSAFVTPWVGADAPS